MRILNIHEVNDVRLDPKDAPVAGDKDVVIKVKACGICGSDLSYIKYGGIMRKPGGVTPIGHEAAGEVLSVGKDVEGITVGQRVAINPMNTSTNIGSGGPEGAFTEQVLVGDARLGDNLIPLADDVPYEIGAMTEPLAVALHGVNRGQVKAGDKVAVFGCGPIGLGMIIWLVDRGANVVALDLAPERLERAKALGAHHVINPGTEDVRAKLIEYHGTGRVLNRDAVGTDVYLDAAGAPTLLNDIVSNMAKFQSRMVITAAHMKPVEINLGKMLTTEMTITTAVGYPDEFAEVVANLGRLQDKIATLISHRLPLGEVIEGLKIAATPQSAKVMIECDA
ncbi:MAG TPA: zinc-binding dehydrogenase [Sphingobium sp.]|uniref:zinc-dependent alcohol dehydrogenase n=1 Tax=Sphingobium sp. TaxID=1912891 RepID=UPI002ED26CAC